MAWSAIAVRKSTSLEEEQLKRSQITTNILIILNARNAENFTISSPRFGS